MCRYGTGGAARSPPSPFDFDRVVALLLAFHALGFLFFRIGELVPLFLRLGPVRCASASFCLGAVALGTVAARGPSSPGRREKAGGGRVRAAFHVYFASVVALIYLLDHRMPRPLPPADGRVGKGPTVVVTGANAGVGYEASRRLAVDYGADVILGCRSTKRCDDAARSIEEEVAEAGSAGTATPMRIDISDWTSVEDFAEQLRRRGKVDVLVNNAGYVPRSGEPVHPEYGLDPSFASMHLGHFLLAERLVKRNPALRVVATSSSAHHLCALPFAYAPNFLFPVVKFFIPQRPGCIDEEYLASDVRRDIASGVKAYVEAKVANVLHVRELPRRRRRATAIAVDLGWVGTSIQWWMRGQPSVKLGWMRNVRAGTVPLLRAVLADDEDLRTGKGGDEGGFLVDTFGRAVEPFDFPWWKNVPVAGEGREQMARMGERLWEESVQILRANGHR
ncbi:hypothetical protein ACHAWF_010440 [Thalassiosira exigua]